MAKILWLNWSGGGNLPPSLGVARALQERGHTIAFAGRPEMVPRVKTAGFRAIELTRAYEQVDRYPQGTFLTRMSCYLTSPAVEEEVQSVAAAEAPDVAVIDAMFPAALAQAVEFNAPTAVFVHTFVFRQLDMWRGMFARLDGMRRDAGFAGLPGLDALWGARDLIVSTSLAEFDAGAHPGWERVRHAGPVLEDERFAVATPLPWPESDETPLVLVSFSTGFEQRNVDKVQRALDALADLPVHVVATTGSIVAPNEVATPRNAVVLNYAAHDPIMRRAALVITHAGMAPRCARFGTACRWWSFPALREISRSSPPRCRNSARAWRCPATQTPPRCERRLSPSSVIRPTGPKRGAAPKRCHAPTARRAPPARSRRC